MSGRKNRKTKRDAGGLGNSLVNSRFKRNRRPGEGNHGPIKYNIPDTEISAEDRLRSKTDDYTLGDYVTDAELEGKTFTALRGNVKIVDRLSLSKDAFILMHRTPEQAEAEDRLKDRLRIPRRPHWDETTTAEELHEHETAELIEWRHALSVIEEDTNVTLSPFEKNPEVWKELWHVLERSQVSVYIIDARDPLAFLCDDFSKYLQEINLPLLIAVNKADLVPQPIRQEWLRYFNSKNSSSDVTFEFVSASPGVKESDISSPKQIIMKAKSLAKGAGRDGKITIGFVGFPNVGKSSMLNAAVGKVVCRSSSTPGKTKHLQTFNLEEDGITLCDCPGLVFPMFQQSRAAMICNGILNIDQMTDYAGPMAIVCSQIPSAALNALYGTHCTGTYADPQKFLWELNKIRGYTVAMGNPDEARVAKEVLKDFTSGKLLHCELPPGVMLNSSKKEEEEEEEEEDGEEEEAAAEKKKLPEAVMEAMQPAAAKKGAYDINPKKRGVVRISSLL